jgi:hypothetical protein
MLAQRPDDRGPNEGADTRRMEKHQRRERRVPARDDVRLAVARRDEGRLERNRPAAQRLVIDLSIGPVLCGQKIRQLHLLHDLDASIGAGRGSLLSVGMPKVDSQIRKWFGER